MLVDNLDDLIEFNGGYVADNDILDVLSEDQELYGKWVDATQKELTEASDSFGEALNKVLEKMQSDYRVMSLEPGETLCWYFEHA